MAVSPEEYPSAAELQRLAEDDIAFDDEKKLQKLVDDLMPDEEETALEEELSTLLEDDFPLPWN